MTRENQALYLGFMAAVAVASIVGIMATIAIMMNP
jgi:hypothetical protein